MRRFVVVVGLLAVLVLAGAVPALASDGDLLGSGVTAPGNGGQPAHVVEVHEAVSTAAVGHDVLAATGIDSGVLLLIGVGLATAGGAAVFATRKRATA